MQWQALLVCIVLLSRQTINFNDSNNTSLITSGKTNGKIISYFRYASKIIDKKKINNIEKIILQLEKIFLDSILPYLYDKKNVSHFVVWFFQSIRPKLIKFRKNGDLNLEIPIYPLDDPGWKIVIFYFKAEFGGHRQLKLP